MAHAWTVEPGSKVKLADFDPADTLGMEKEAGQERLEELGNEIAELQELMFAARRTGLLCVFQGRDTAGKDGAINRILRYTNVQGCHTTGFKVPTETELAHDFLWRVHARTPGRGEIALFNRSHYEDVLVVRVHELVPEAVWRPRYEQINAFEELLAASGAVILKFYLHISKKEQEQRLLEREKEAEKAWKLSAGDWREREHWDAYTAAYEEALSRCSTPHAPWLIIPADKKWVRDVAVAEAIRAALAPLRDGWMKTLDEIGRKARAELDAYRSGAAAK